MAAETVNALGHRLEGMRVELSSARAGTFIGDSYNDTPQSAQRASAIAIDLAEVGGRLAGARLQLASVEADLEEAHKQLQQRSKAVLALPHKGRVWEMMSKPGEFVSAGQDLMRVVDCNSTLVTASVSEATFQKLAVGQPATFALRDGGYIINGTVVALNGLASVQSSTAIPFSALQKEPYNVTLRFPGLAVNSNCSVGHSGLVTFDTSARATMGAPTQGTTTASVGAK